MAGGGVAWIAAAVSAAKGGANVILADNNGYLGASALALGCGADVNAVDVKEVQRVLIANDAYLQ